MAENVSEKICVHFIEHTKPSPPPLPQIHKMRNHRVLKYLNSRIYQICTNYTTMEKIFFENIPFRINVKYNLTF